MSQPKLQHYLIVIAIALGFMFLMRSHAKNQQPKLAYGSANEHLLQQENHFRNLRQLTFSGENAEAYFSSDLSLIHI